ncbi:MAG TPA: hypothetical protein VJT73_15890 [Polyangiaceae bacterium]|nr:hypothetical protein [Polyangiaceae bacterium]
MPLTHLPPEEQATLTPVPIWVEAPDESVAKVVVSYKAFGNKGWTDLPLVKGPKGWGAEVPCNDVGTVVGWLRYYVTAYDAQGTAIGSSASQQKPHRVRIRRTIKGEPLHLPDQPPPSRCADTADCPPEFPGCRALEAGESVCSADDDCDEGMVCNAQKCESPASKQQKKNWIVIGARQNVIFFSESNYCTPLNQAVGNFSCLRQSDGAPYHGSPLPEEVHSFFGPATTAIFVGYDRFVAKHFTVGVRGGYVFRGLAPELENRSRTLPILAEARGAWWIGVEGAVRPMLFVAGGYAPTDIKFRDIVYENTAMATAQPDNPPSQTLDVWSSYGPWFAGAGAGAMFATSSAAGVIVEVEVARTFPIQSTIVAPSLAFAVGF